jgi:hypothetical protein
VILVRGTVGLADFDAQKLERALRELLRDPAAQRIVPRISGGQVRELYTDLGHLEKAGEVVELYERHSALDPVRGQLGEAIERCKRWATLACRFFSGWEDEPVTVKEVNNVAVIFGDSGARSSEVHQDSDENQLFGVFCFTRGGVPPFQFCDPDKLQPASSLEIVRSLLQPHVPRGQRLDETDLLRLERSELVGGCSNLFRPRQELEAALTPAVDGEWQLGDAVLVRGNVPHTNPRWDGYRCVLFLSLSKPESMNRYSFDDQSTAVVVLGNMLAFQKLYGEATMQVMARAFLAKLLEYRDLTPWVRYEKDAPDFAKVLEAFVRQGGAATSSDVDQALKGLQFLNS